jgi:Protein of unknown function (DUF3667)
VSRRGRRRAPAKTAPARSDTGGWTCPNCHKGVTTPHCALCGERRPRPEELTFKGTVHQALVAFTNLDGRLVRSIRTLVRHPGRLTVLYLEGARRPYIGPIALFLLANVLFVAMESLTGANIFSTPLDNHLHDQAWSPLAQDLTAQRLEAKHLSLEAYAPVFDKAVAAHAKSLVGLMVLPFALLPAMLYYKARRPLAANLAFSLHFHAFMLLLMSFALLIPALSTRLGGPGLASPLMDTAMSIGLVSICGLHLYQATEPVYGAVGMLRGIKTAVLILGAASVFLGYRFLLFLLTLYTT